MTRQPNFKLKDLQHVTSLTLLPHGTWVVYIDGQQTDFGEFATTAEAIAFATDFIEKAQAAAVTSPALPPGTVTSGYAQASPVAPVPAPIPTIVLTNEEPTLGK